MSGLTPAGVEGFWGPVTSTLDWCEENYLLSHYVAEWWNTTSNLVFHVTALIGIYNAVRVKAEARIIYSFLALAVVGTGSAAFHGSLTYEMQLMDELPMIYGSCIFVFSTLQTFPPGKFPTLTSIVLAVYALFVTVVYIMLRDPVFHQVSYAVLVAITSLVPIAHINKLGRIYPGTKRVLWFLYVTSLGSYLFGFLLWNIDNFYCDAFRSWKNTTGYPLRVLGELHAWWHLLTGYGSYGSVILSQYMRLLALGKANTVEFKYYGILPVIVPRDHKRGKGE
ncbi:uncharacterized protein SPPG_04885 [Spizellomyces punctatus DAOM BR117]|uniref:Alkaline phytoceramidase n=1 Tax=Spizellomyces punctatus (strain DAOM BR117) TaxID=645134 RepID=A0A0L0HES6_SPIPD|nr:uncharacterized protein SPPG_04885 [Spizellomyces punctatus DAOM BR117]KNC99489.1 hypothetical protein SPPG_04885 [Spizellomyces punctatus DAOM BR117]|eukprot:XP_016607529.1 hypothetical protein SPPG_04885 [Spizellomyces punctatus DAOM BR117]